MVRPNTSGGVLGRPLGRRASTVALALIAATLLGVGGFVVRDLLRANQEAREMYLGSVQGLDVIGDLQYQTQEARRSVLYALTTTDPNLQVEYADQSREADRRVAKLLRTHMGLQRSPEGTEADRSFEADWAAYLLIRDEVVASILEGSTREAVDRDLREGVPAFNQLRADLDEIKRIYRDQAGARLARVEGSSRRSVTRLLLIILLSQLLVAISAASLHRGAMLRAVQQSEAALRASEGKFRTLADTVASAIFIYQGDGFRYVNPWTESMTGYARQELLSMNFWDVVHPDDREVVQRGTARLQGPELAPRHEFKIVTKSGEVRWVDFTAAAIEFEGQPAALGTAFDITDRKRAEQRIEHQAYHDALTGLPNRALLMDRLSMAVAHARRHKGTIAVMFLDLDGFKLINDTLGHGFGDRLLQQVAERLSSCLREDDTVGRLGGDEFTLLLPDVARGEDAARIAQKVLDTVARPFDIDGHELFMTTSIGVGLYPGDGDDAGSLLKNADAAMYRAKETGRNNYQLFTPAMNERAASRLSLESGLRRAIERGEFVLHYQPQAALSDRSLVGVEALVRWRHPERGLVGPGEFIPLAEETRLILPLGQWILETACRQATLWDEAGLSGFRVAVNVSGRQFQQQDVLQVVGQALQAARLDPRRLDLEITESAAMQNLELTVAMLRGLREMGVRISVDDFGTGHSSLSRLKRLPLDAVKIDQAFIHDLSVSQSDRAIVKGIIQMAHGLGLHVIAEGVETEGQADFLREQGCDEMQGYLLGKPCPAEDLVEALRSRIA